MKDYIWQIVSGILFILILFHFIQDPVTENKTIIVPQKTGSFQQIKPESIKVPVYHYKTLKGDTITLENPVNEKLASEYETLIKNHDSLKARLMYLEAIQIHKYSQDFEDKHLKATVYAKITGTLDSLKFDYTIKPDTIQVPITKPFATILLGGGLYTSGSGIHSKLELGVQNSKGNIITGGYDYFNKAYFLSYNIKVFTINK